MGFRLEARPIAFSLLLRPKQGMTGSNFEKLRVPSVVVASAADPRVVLEDWCATPEMMHQSGIPGRLGGLIVMPDVAITCDEARAASSTSLWRDKT